MPRYIVTELCDTSLYDLLQEDPNTPLSLTEILHIAVEICMGLRYIHGQNPVVSHRDLSSKNILIKVT